MQSIAPKQRLHKNEAEKKEQDPKSTKTKKKEDRWTTSLSKLQQMKSTEVIR